MAGKISELTALGAPTGAAEIEVLNNGVNYRAPVAGKFVLQTIENLTAGEFDFNSIPSGYKRLIIEGGVRGTAATATETIHGYMNEDLTDANYLSQRLAGQNATVSNTENAEPELAVIPGSTSPAGSYSYIRVVLEDYAGTLAKVSVCTFAGRSTASDLWMGTIASSNTNITTAITRFRVRTDNHPTDQLLGKLTLYGEL